ncbi:MAG: GNAT family N-acetyltransferase, partial [Thomasclavelia ramosa]
METIITERLILRSPDNNDAQTLLKIHNDMATLKFNAMTKYEFAEMIRDIEREHDMMYCIELKNSNNVIGAVFINPDRLRYRVNALSLS